MNLATLPRKLDILRTAKQPVKFLVSRALWGSGACRFLTIRRSGYKLRFFPSAFSANLWLDSTGISDDECFLTGFLRPGQIVVDVGANIGTFSIFSAVRVGENGRVYALEAHPTTASYLRKNILLNGLAPHIEVINCAVGDSVGELSFSDIKSDDQNCVEKGSRNGIAVPASTLDLLISDGCVDLLKIDVEGYELMVLRGATDLLLRTNAIYFEAWDQHFARYGYRFADLWDFLRERGFRIVDWRTRECVPRSQTVSTCINYLAIRETCAGMPG